MVDILYHIVAISSNGGQETMFAKLKSLKDFDKLVSMALFCGVWGGITLLGIGLLVIALDTDGVSGVNFIRLVLATLGGILCGASVGIYGAVIHNTPKKPKVVGGRDEEMETTEVGVGLDINP